jgi:DNA modification methylase
MLSATKIRAEQYDFPTQKASEGRAAIHDYPAMLHYLLVDDLLSSFSKKESIVYDPFCGSGVTIVQALKFQKRVIGTDINPLALLIAETRTLNVIPEKVELVLKKFKKSINITPADIPSITNIEYWFKPDVIEHLGKIRALLLKHDDLPSGKFFKTVFSQTVRNISNNRKGEFKRFRMDKDKLAYYNPNVWETFEQTALKYSQILSIPLYFRSFQLFRHDLRQPLPFSEKVDLVITSPPYGDSKTTVAYGQFSSFSMEWLRGLNPYGDEDLKLDNKMLGGDKKQCPLPPSKSLKQTLNKIKDKKRSDEVKTFFSDLFVSCANIIDKLSDNPTVCFVVGNRTVNGITIPMDEIIKEFFEHFNLKHFKTFIRKINNKRMPSLNSPANLKGDTSPTMSDEYIVIMKG